MLEKTWINCYEHIHLRKNKKKYREVTSIEILKSCWSEIAWTSWTRGRASSGSASLLLFNFIFVVPGSALWDLILQPLVCTLFKSNYLWLCIGRAWELFHIFFSGVITITRICSQTGCLVTMRFYQSVSMLLVSSHYLIDVMIAEELT